MIKLTKYLVNIFSPENGCSNFRIGFGEVQGIVYEDGMLSSRKSVLAKSVLLKTQPSLTVFFWKLFFYINSTSVFHNNEIVLPNSYLLLAVD